MADLFAAMQRDHDVPLAARALLSDLARPATSLAQRDPSVLADLKHALWQLINRFGAAASLYPSDSAEDLDPRLVELLTYGREQLAPGLAADGADSVSCIKLLSGLELVIGRIRQAQLDQAKEAIEKIERVERETAGMARAVRVIDARLTGLVVPSPLRLFLKGPWLTVLSKLMDTRGPQSAATLQAQSTVDALLETLTVLADPAQRVVRVRQIGAVRAQIKAGLSLTTWSPGESEAFLNKLSQMQALVLAARPAADGAADAAGLADVAVRPMTADELRAEMSRADAATSGPSHPTAGTTMPMIDAQALATVPADLMGDDTTSKPLLVSMVPGDSCRLFLGGDFQPMQLLWVSPQQRFWLFAGPKPGTVTSLARLALEQLDAAGLIKPLHPMSLLDRCLARISGVVDTHF